MGATAATREATFARPIGREHEIELLEELVRAVAIGEKRAAVFLGPSGVGKTTLLRCCAELCAREDIITLSVRAPATAGLPPLFPIGEIVGGLVAACRARRIEPPDLVLRMEEALRATGERPAFPIALPQVADAFERVGEARPTAILFDDYHWAPREGASLLLATLRVVETPVLFVATARLRREGEESVAPPPEPTADLWVDLVHLRGLDARGTALLVERELGGPLLPSLAEIAYEHSMGNPLFVTEMLRRWRTDGAVRPVGGYWALTEGDHAVPGSLKEMVAGRLAALKGGSRKVVGVLAVLGRDASFEEVRAVSGLPTAELVESIGDLAALGFISEEGQPPRYWLAHPLYGPSVMARLGPTGQAALHQEIFEGLRRSSGRAVPDAEIAHHAVRALERPADLRDLIMAAASEADRVGSYEEAARWYEHLAKETVENSALGEALERQATATTNFDPHRAVEVFTQALEIATNPERQARLLRGRAGALRILGRFEDALADLQIAISTASHHEQFLILHRTATIYGLQGRIDEAERLLSELVRAPIPDAEKANALSNLGTAAFTRGDLGRAVQMYTQACQVSCEYGARIHATQNLIWMHILLGRWKEARRALDATIRQAVQMGDAWYLLSLLADAARLHAWQGRFPEALDCCLRANRLAPRLRNPTCQIECLEAEGIVYLEGERYREAVELLSEAAALIRTSSETREAAFTFANLAEATYRLGDWRSALAILREAETYLSQSPVWLVAVERVRAACFTISGRPLEALEMLGELTVRSSALPLEHAKILLQIAAVNQQCGRKKAALTALEESLVLFDELGATHRSKAVRFAIASIASRRRGRPRAEGPANLTPRELEVLGQIAHGRTNKEIGLFLFVSARTVAKHVENILAKTGLQRRAELVSLALREGLV